MSPWILGYHFFYSAWLEKGRQKLQGNCGRATGGGYFILAAKPKMKTALKSNLWLLPASVYAVCDSEAYREEGSRD